MRVMASYTRRVPVLLARWLAPERSFSGYTDKAATGGLKMVLTTEQREQFARDGFLPYGRILRAEEIEPLRAEYDRVFAEAPSGGGLRNLSSDEEHPQMLQLMQLCERSLLFRRLLYDARILD